MALLPGSQTVLWEGAHGAVLGAACSFRRLMEDVRQAGFPDFLTTMAQRRSSELRGQVF